MKSFVKISLLFALIITGRYLQPTATATLAARPAAPTSAQALPLVLARYTTTPQLSATRLSQSAHASSAYYL